MKLLSINNYYYRRDGSEVVYLEHNKIFEDLGWQVIPFSMAHPENLYSPWSKYFVNELDYGQNYSLTEKIIRVPKVIYSIEARQKLDRLIRTIRPDITHCHSIYHHISPSILDVLRQHKIPVVMTLHDLKIACPSYHMFAQQKPCERCKNGKLHNVFLNRCVKGSLSLSAIVMTESLIHRIFKTYEKSVSRFIVPCKFYKRKLVEWGWPEEKFVHIPNFIDSKNYEAEPAPGKAFLYFGRLSPEKGLITLIEAAARAKVPLQLAGDGPQSDALKAHAQRIGADVVFLGHLQNNKLWDAVRSARATVLPSEWYENGPMSILESYALGKAVIGANIGGIPEMVSHLNTGFLFESGSVEALSQTLRLFYDLPNSEIFRMGNEARKMVEIKYSSENYRCQMSRLYENICANYMNKL